MWFKVFNFWQSWVQILWIKLKKIIFHPIVMKLKIKEYLTAVIIQLSLQKMFLSNINYLGIVKILRSV